MIPLLIKLALGSGIALSAGNDFDFGNNKDYLRRYPDLACLDEGELPHSEVDPLTAAKIQEMGRKEAIQVTRPHCFGADGPDGPATVSDTITGSEWLDRLYARLTAGPIPHGFFDGLVILSRDRGVKSISELGLWMPKEARLESIMQRFWAGKFFDRDKMFLKNRINLDGFDFRSAPKALTDKRMNFPAKLYCGQSLFDSRRESIIIDYKYGVEDRPEGVTTNRAIDWLAGPEGLGIRDEIRMVHPGLYLGRAYIQGAFGLYFVLEYKDGTGVKMTWNEPESCWLGHQRQIQKKMRPSDYRNNTTAN